ncbi:hypothetical protein CspeluHIS016_0308330 [Cutaneotrichosporon spelunceum]|uniref:Pinin/SDK/MemA protein domain-containing protein n=1 Tax=Cutaneotrichosporon spelunceum TaxID=1672016 RepID=A0AAD3YCD0_9TREE|nr:hypothetical protein CspeluHIS016_0308330 [Cutaneotrichosporon spelunceum]
MEVEAKARSPPPARETGNSPEKRPAEEPERPTKRTRTREDQARGRRMFGNILGTLRKFQDEDKSSKRTEAAKRREETSARIAEKLRSEANAHQELGDAERELRTLRIQVDNAGYVLGHREIAMRARHRTLQAASKYLFTASTPGAHDGTLFPTSPAPIAQRRSGPTPSLYFLPKELLPHQEEELKKRQESITHTIEEETDALERDQRAAKTKAEESDQRIIELEEKVRRLRATKDARRDRERERSPSPRARRSSGRERENLRSRSRSRSRSPSSHSYSAAPPLDDEMQVEY